MAKRQTKPSPRVVRSLHLSPGLDRQISRAARLSDESIVQFIRQAAEDRARSVIGDDATPSDQAAQHAAA